ncbi:MAG: (d)CMP kinase [Brevinema sp.]
MVITIDGPAGSGKSSISQEFAKRIDFDVLDTGAMYRCVALLLEQTKSSLDDPSFQQRIIDINIIFNQKQVFLNGQDVSVAIRTPSIDNLTSTIVSTHYFVREHLCSLQRKLANQKNIVVEGRDMGTNVFPNALLKFYLTATPQIRTKRRQIQLQEKGISKTLNELETEINQRDLDDSTRELNPLCIPKDAHIIDTSILDPKQVLEEILNYYYLFKGSYKNTTKI